MRKLLLLTFLAALLAGCSGGGSPQAGSSAEPQPGETVRGTVSLRHPLAGIPVRMEGLDGAPLAVATPTDARGAFAFPGGDYPADFRLLADVPGFGTLVREVRGSAGPVHLGVVGHLVAAEFASHPAAGLPEADRRMKAFLALPPRLALDGAPWLGERQSAFSDDLFLRQAAQAGGVQPFVALLLAELQAGATRSFAEDPVKKTDWETFLDKVGGDLTADVPDGFGDAAIGYALSLMGCNTGEERALQQVAQDLDALGDQIDALSVTLAQGFADSAFQAAAGELERSTLSPVETRSERLAANALRFRITDEPFQPDSELVSLTSLVTSFHADTALENLTNALLGQSGASNMLVLGMQVLQARFGLVHSGPLSEPSGLWSNGAVVTPMDALAEFYSSYATEALNLLLEVATSGPRPGQAIPSGRRRLVNLAATLKAAALQIPPPLPGAPGDVYLVDYANGRMWYLREQYPVQSGDVMESWSGSDSTVIALAPYDDWRYPHNPSGGTNDLKLLFDRLKAANPAHPSQALATLRFTAGWDPSTPPPNGDTLYGYVDTDSSGLVQDSTGHLMDLETGQTSSWPRGESPQKTLCVRVFPNTAPTRDPDYLGDRDPDAARATGVLTSLDPPVATTAAVTVTGTWTVSSSVASLQVPGLDATARVVWTSSNPDTCVVSNGTGTEGTLTWYRNLDGSLPGPVTITASTSVSVDASGNVTPQGLQVSVVVAPPGDLPARTLTAVSVTPRNRTYLIPDVTEQYYATAYWSDGLVTDVTDDAVWSVAQADGSPLPDPSKAFFEHGSPGVLALKPLLTVADLRLTAAFGGQSRSVKAKVAVD